jgi:hypothetical protein
MTGIVKIAYYSSREDDYHTFHDPLNSDKDRMSALQDYIKKTKGLEPASGLAHGLVGAGIGGLVGLAASKGSSGGLVAGGIAGALHAEGYNREIAQAKNLSGRSTKDLRNFMIRESSSRRGEERQSDRAAQHYAAYRSYKY